MGLTFSSDKKIMRKLNLSKSKESKIAKKVLLIGINYKGTNSQLNGCINDSENIKAFLIQNGYFKKSDFIMMNDNEKGSLSPTKKNILKKFKELVKFANDNKNKQVNLFIGYSGHGSSVTDTTGDEIDGRDEALCPIDYDKAGFIIDDEIKAQLIDKLPSNVKLFILIDACHSGSVCDLKYEYDLNKNLTFKTNEKMSESAAEVVMISGCKDDQTSLDAYLYDKIEKRDEYQGAMTACFISVYNKDLSYKELVTNMRLLLRLKKCSQIPQLSSGKYIDVTSKCMLTGF